MNIDLLMGKFSQSGLLCSRAFKQNPIGAIFDVQARALILEFSGDIDPLHLNISVEERFTEQLLTDRALYIVALDNNMIAEAIEVPLAYLNDPYGGSFDPQSMVAPHRAVIAVEQFLKRCSFAQPIHRSDLGDESTLSGITGGEDVRGLKFSPALLRARELERTPSAAPVHAPNFGLGTSNRAMRTKNGDESDY